MLCTIYCENRHGIENIIKSKDILRNVRPVRYADKLLVGSLFSLSISIGI